jgi:cytochrome c-type biogenesis protein CcmH
MRRLLIILCFLLVAPLAHAVEPDEILKDPGLEARARALSEQLPLARDLRLLIREHLVKGETDSQIMDFIVARYGDFVLLKPRFTTRTIVLWLTPFVTLLVAIVALLRRRGGAVASGENPLTDEEKAALQKALE